MDCDRTLIDDYVPSMGEDFFSLLEYNHTKQSIISFDQFTVLPQDCGEPLVFSSPNPESRLRPDAGCGQKSTKPSVSAFRDGGKMDESGNEFDDPRMKKKRKHRVIERQRRQELTDLFAALRSQLPLEYLQGKRSVADQVHEATNYVENLKKSIEELSKRRESLKRLSNFEYVVPGISSSSSSSDQQCSTSSCVEDQSSTSVVVMPCLAGVEIVISTSGEHPGQRFSLARALSVMQTEGLDVVSCVSSRVQGRFIHTILSQVGDVRKIDMDDLREKLTQEKI